jgi:hypothetical protein
MLAVRNRAIDGRGLSPPRSATLLAAPGPFPPPALPGFTGTTDLPPPQTARSDPHGSPVGEHVSPPLGFPVLRRFPYACMLSLLPRRNQLGARIALFPSGGSLPCSTARSASALWISRPFQRSIVTACKLAGSHMTLCIVGFDDLVTSFVATIATGWSDPCRVGLSPTEKPRLHAAHHAVATAPGQRLGLHSLNQTQPYQPSPKGLSGRPAHCPFRGLLGVHSRYGLHTRAVTVNRDT